MRMKQVSHNFHAYRISTSTFDTLLNKGVPQEDYFTGVKKPHFFGATHKDYICVAHIAKFQTLNANPYAKIVDFDTDHWVPLAQPQKLNEELLAWIESAMESV